MKKMIIALLCVLLLLSGCANAQISNNNTGASSASSEKETTTYESQIKKEECALCSQHGNTMLPAYSGQKNLGIICINTFDISPIEINRYDDFGNLIEKPSETFSIMHNGFGEGNMNTHVTPNPDRGYANVDVLRMFTFGHPASWSPWCVGWLQKQPRHRDEPDPAF